MEFKEPKVNTRAATGVLLTEPLHQRAALRLRDLVVEGRLRPGEAISEKDLCDEFGISRTPLREALKILSFEGLIQLLPRRGAIVAPIVTEQLQQKFEVVRVLEDFAVKLMCERATDVQIAELKAVHKRLVDAVKRGDSNFVRLNDEFHDVIMRASGNQSLLEVHAPLWQHLRRVRQLALNVEDVSRGYVQAVDRLMKAISKRDSAAAVKEMEARWEIAARVIASWAGPANHASVGRVTWQTKTRGVR
jgi:DNA-binding GntR family transcriptional regulator